LTRYVRDGRQAYCRSCGASACSAFHGLNDDTEQRAITAWNTRSPKGGVSSALREVRHWFAGYIANGGKGADEELRLIDTALAQHTVAPADEDAELAKRLFAIAEEIQERSFDPYCQRARDVWNAAERLASKGADDGLTDEAIEAGAKQMRAVLDDGGWDDETIFSTALQVALSYAHTLSPPQATGSEK
jgi:hypothetical protein